MTKVNTKPSFVKMRKDFGKNILYFWCVVVSLIIPCASKAARGQKKGDRLMKNILAMADG